ncbi:MAG: hypothetical protein ABIR11_04700, partial [Candidatus Limnocylindrales bacterium]
MTSRTLVGRVVALAGTVALISSLLATSVAAAPSASARAAGHTRDRGTVVPAVAAARARGVERPTIKRPLRALPGLAERAVTPNLPTQHHARIIGPLPVVATEFPGISQAPDGLALEPPDPWIAVSPSHVVQSTNGLVRISTRAGTVLQSVPTWALFGLDPSELDSDPRILWDKAKSRWIGVLLSYQSDFSFNYLNVAVSDTSDPTGAWRIFSYEYTDDLGAPTLPDYPGIASSTDKVVLTANEFNGPDFVGGSVLVMKWSDILAGVFPNPSLWTFADPGVYTPRPALVESSSADVHLVSVDAAGTDYQYAKLTGSAPTSIVWHGLGGIMTGYCEATAPRQPGIPATITDAVDGRPTDAAWFSNTLAVVSTCSSGGDDYTRVSTLNTTTNPPSLIRDDLIGAGLGTDTFMGGIGFTGAGSLMATYTRSSASLNPSAWAAVYYAGSWKELEVTEGPTGYLGTRWGDYTAVAQDPSGSGAVWSAAAVPDASGGWATSVQRLVFDLTSPLVTAAPTQALISGTTLASYTVPVKVSWTTSDPGSGVVRTNLNLDRFGSGYTPAGSATGTSTTRSHYWKDSTNTSNFAHQYAAQAVDAYGNASAFVPGTKLTPVVYQTSGTTFSGSWGTSTSSSYSGGSSRYSSSAGASASFKTSGRSFAFVTTKASSRGKVKVYLDGVLKTTLTLTLSTTKYRTLAYVVTFTSSATHTIKLVVSSGRV